MLRPRRYPSDLTDEQWALVGPLLPAPKRGGRPEKHPRRSIVDAVLYVVRTGCAWRYLPGDFPPWQTVYWYFKQWEEAKVTEAMLTTLRERARIQQGRNPQPSAGIIDSQSIKGADTVGRGSRGYDAGKKINGRKRCIVTDTLGLLINVVVLAASVQDRDGARTTLLSMYLAAPIRFVFADGGFTGKFGMTIRRAVPDITTADPAAEQRLLPAFGLPRGDEPGLGGQPGFTVQPHRPGHPDHERCCSLRKPGPQRGGR
ncbi:IS5 family transposase [Dactylosporangium salmoneum]|uniref:Transposase n=1 Tax=Dactylosporangium salmoneum TaxID=53361 RepID=A0ABP5SYB9_9ACTN